MAMKFKQWHIEELVLDTDSNTQGAIPVIYGRQGDRDGVLCNISLTQQGLPVAPEWFTGKRIFFESRGNGVSVRKEVEAVESGIVKVVIPESTFTNVGLVPENFLRVEEASTSAVVISGTTSFRVYVRQGNLDPNASKYYLEEIEVMALSFKAWMKNIMDTIPESDVTELALKHIQLEEFVAQTTIAFDTEEPRFADIWYRDIGEAIVDFTIDTELLVQNATVADDEPVAGTKLWFDEE